MMNNNNHHNSECSFAAEIAGYIYGEIGKQEKSVFEAHLADCATCPEELADLMDIRFSINDWKQTEFAPLATPAIEIPYETRQNTDKREIAAVSVSWWSNLRQIFTLSPAWTTATALAAALVVCLGLIFTIGKFSTDSEVAELEKNSVKPVLSPTADALSNKNSEKTKETDAKTSAKTTEPPTFQPPAASENNAGDVEKNVVKIAERSPKTRAVTQNSGTKTTNNSANNANKSRNPQNSPVKNQQLPQINNIGDDEDDSLRLAELFDDLDTMD